jgi:hypothetical protein
MIEVTQKTMTPISDVYDLPITMFFYYASYLVEQNRKQIAEMKKISNRH